MNVLKQKSVDTLETAITAYAYPLNQVLEAVLRFQF
jgi:hypothetical protein